MTNEQWFIYTISSHSLNSPILHLPSFNLVNVNATLLLRSFHCWLFTVPVPEPWQTFEMSVNEYLGWELYLTLLSNSAEEWRDKDNRVITKLYMCSYMNVCMQYTLHSRKVTLGIPFNAVSFQLCKTAHHRLLIFCLTLALYPSFRRIKFGRFLEI